jgi:carbonic anhydrase
VGAIYDFVNALGKGHGRLIITSVNGITEAKKIKALPQLAGLDLNNCLIA